MDQEVPLSPSEAETSWLDYYEIAYRKRTRFFYVRIEVRERCFRKFTFFMKAE